MKVTEAAFVKGFIRMANDGWEQGWHERNGGNLSYRIAPAELDEVKDQLKEELLAEKQRKAYESRINQLKILFPVDRF